MSLKYCPLGITIIFSLIYENKFIMKILTSKKKIFQSVSISMILMKLNMYKICVKRYAIKSIKIS